MHFLSQLPTLSLSHVWLVGALVVFVILCGYVLSSLQTARKNLTEEIRRELASTAQPSPVTVQQPLHVKAAVEFATKEQHEKLASEMEKDRDSRRQMHREIAELQGDVKKLGAEITGAQTSVGEVKSEIKENTKLTAKIDGKVEQINQSVAQLNSTITQFMRDHSKK